MSARHDTHEAHHHDHDGDGHVHGGQHAHGRLRRLVRDLVAPHSHDHAVSIDSATATREGMRALTISLAVLGATAIAQLVVFAFSGSVALLADTVHNFSDALTAVPLGVAFWLGRRPPNRRYTYGYGRAEDLAGIFIVMMITLSAGVAAWEAIHRLLNPQPLRQAGWVALAGLIGFAGNELVAKYRIRVGRRIGSAALVADGLHARTDGLTSLAVLAAAVGAMAGWDLADPIIGLAISAAIINVLRVAARDISHRLMDRIDPDLVERIEHQLHHVEGFAEVGHIRARWVGHDLYVDADVIVDGRLLVDDVTTIIDTARHRLTSRVPRLTDVRLNTTPRPRSAGSADARAAASKEAR